MAGGGQHASLDAGPIGINTYSALTTELWFTPSPEIAGTWVQAMSFGRHGIEEVEGEAAWQGWQYLMFQPGREDGVARAEMSAASLDDAISVDHPEEIADGSLHHVVLTVDSTDLAFYLDGTLVGTTEIGANTLDTLSNELALLGASVYQL